MAKHHYARAISHKYISYQISTESEKKKFLYILNRFVNFVTENVMKILSAAPELLNAGRNKEANFVMSEEYYFVTNIGLHYRPPDLSPSRFFCTLEEQQFF
jgi:hypothetical protein